MHGGQMWLDLCLFLLFLNVHITRLLKIRELQSLVEVRAKTRRLRVVISGTILNTQWFTERNDVFDLCQFIYIFCIVTPSGTWEESVTVMIKCFSWDGGKKGEGVVFSTLKAYEHWSSECVKNRKNSLWPHRRLTYKKQKQKAVLSMQECAGEHRANRHYWLERPRPGTAGAVSTLMLWRGRERGESAELTVVGCSESGRPAEERQQRDDPRGGGKRSEQTENALWVVAQAWKPGFATNDCFSCRLKLSGFLFFPLSWLHSSVLRSPLFQLLCPSLA